MKKLLVLPFLFFVLSLLGQNDSIIVINKDIQLHLLRDSVYRHVTWEVSPDYGRFSCNGLVYVNNGHAVIADTPMDTGKTHKLISHLEKQMALTIDLVIVGHFHSDCIGGLPYVHERGIPSLGGAKTLALCKQNRLPVPTESFEEEYVLVLQGDTLICRYPGAGHTEDNITVYCPKQHILFGGCLVKSARSRGLGNLVDANVHAWPATMQHLLDTYTEADLLVVPGHGLPGNKELLQHTQKLARSHLSKTNKVAYSF